MYQSEVSEKMIEEVTGHKSDCVRLYKCTSDDIRKAASNTISGSDVKCEESNVDKKVVVKEDVEKKEESDEELKKL